LIGAKLDSSKSDSEETPEEIPLPEDSQTSDDGSSDAEDRSRHEFLVLRKNLLRYPPQAKDLPPLGFLRLSVVKVVQAAIVTNFREGNRLLAQSDLVCACLDLFFLYHHHSILHAIIAYIVRYILAMGSEDLIEMLIMRYQLPRRISMMFQWRSMEDPVLEGLRGYLKMLAIACKNSPRAQKLLREETDWHRFTKEILEKALVSPRGTQMPAKPKKYMWVRKPPVNPNKKGSGPDTNLSIDKLEDGLANKLG